MEGRIFFSTWKKDFFNIEKNEQGGKNSKIKKWGCLFIRQVRIIPMFVFWDTIICFWYCLTFSFGRSYIKRGDSKIWRMFPLNSSQLWTVSAEIVQMNCLQLYGISIIWLSLNPGMDEKKMLRQDFRLD